jgi:hypothetical protein
MSSLFLLLNGENLRERKRGRGRERERKREREITAKCTKLQAKRS